MPPTDTGLPRASFLILLSLSDRPRHGLAIIDRVDELTHGDVRMGPGTLYGTLQRLLAAGLVREQTAAPDPEDDDPRRRYYRVTPKGDRAVKLEAARLRLLVDAAAASRLLGDA